MVKDKKRARRALEVMHIAIVECHSLQCWCDGWYFTIRLVLLLPYGLYLILPLPLMEKITVHKVEPGIYSTSLVSDDGTDATTTTYHPLKKQTVNQHQLTVELPTAYNYRARTNSNIIERRFSNVEQPTFVPELICK
jgi:hypothetical protein